ncbi:MAG TPA: hypothetical protein VIJ03_10150 [Candidatus Dormibacteraeota bacterium]
MGGEPRFGGWLNAGIRSMMSGMRKGSVVKLTGGREIPKGMITLVFDGTSGPMRFEVARTDVTVRESRPWREDRSPALAR